MSPLAVSLFLWLLDAIYMSRCSAQGILGLCQSWLSLSLSDHVIVRFCLERMLHKFRIPTENTPHQSGFLAPDVTYLSACLLVGVKSFLWL